MNNLLKTIIKTLTYQENLDREGFILRENDFDRQAWKKQQDRSGGENSGGNKPRQGGGGQTESVSGSHGGRDQESAGDGGGQADQPAGGGGRQPSAPDRTRRRAPRKIKKPGQEDEASPGQDGGDRVRARLDENRKKIEQIYNLPENADIIIREFTVGTENRIRAFMVYIDGMTTRADQNSLLQDLMLFSGDFSPPEASAAASIMRGILPGSQVKNLDSFKKIAESVNYGDTAFFFEGSASAVTVETKGWEHRSVDRPQNEQTITGPQEAFVENMRANTALIRKIVRSETLITEFFQVGTRIRSDVALMYMSDLANPDLVEEARRRLSGITYDFVPDSGILEQLIEDSPYNLNPQTLMTERPDRVASFLSEGRVAILLSGSPFALVVPATMYAQLHTGEETYLRWQYGTFLRYIRTISFYLALLLPGSYLAIVLYHHEMIPTELLLAIAGNREKVPFPTVFEMLLMEFSFELVREAGLRIPGLIGSTIGIVGALILGQAAVQANIVSPILVILVAVTGLASFSIPSYSLAFAVRIYRFFYILMGSVLGFYGITIALFTQILLTANLKSFGVPYLSPTGPRTYTGQDVVNRMPIFMHRRRPDQLNPLDDVRMPEEPRGWVKGGGGHGKGDPGQG